MDDAKITAEQPNAASSDSSIQFGRDLGLIQRTS